MPTSKDRPRAWNDDVIWLLERVAGILASQGAGTGSGDLPRGIAASDVFHYLRLTPSDLDDSAVVALQMPTTDDTQWALAACQLHSSDGSATQWAPRFGQTATFADDGPDDRLGFASQAFTAPYRVVLCKAVPMHPDGDGKLYLKPGLNAGSDNDLDLQLWFRQLVTTETSTP
jgi:hypothetical protein